MNKTLSKIASLALAGLATLVSAAPAQADGRLSFFGEKDDYKPFVEWNAADVADWTEALGFGYTDGDRYLAGPTSNDHAAAVGEVNTPSVLLKAGNTYRVVYQIGNNECNEDNFSYTFGGVTTNVWSPDSPYLWISDAEFTPTVDTQASVTLHFDVTSDCITIRKIAIYEKVNAPVIPEDPEVGSVVVTTMDFNARVGEPITINGLFYAAEAGDYYVYVSQGSDSYPVYSLVAGENAISATATFSEAGSYTCTLVVMKGSEEVARSEEFTIVVTGIAPDYYAASIDAGFPSIVNAEEDFTVTATVENLGQDIEEGRVEFFYVNAEGEDQVLDAETINNLAYNGVRNIPLRGNFLKGGEYDVYVRVIVGEEVLASAIGHINVIGKPHAIVTPIWHEGQVGLYELDVEVTNNGSVDLNDVRFSITVDGGFAPLQAAQGNVAVGETKTFKVSRNFAETGTYNVVVKMQDASGYVAESEPADVVISEAVVKSVNLTLNVAEEFELGDVFEGTVTVENKGTVDFAGKLWVKGNNQNIATPVNVEVAAGQTQEVEVVGEAMTVAGEYTAIAELTEFGSLSVVYSSEPVNFVVNAAPVVEPEEVALNVTANAAEEIAVKQYWAVNTTVENVGRSIEGAQVNLYLNGEMINSDTFDIAFGETANVVLGTEFNQAGEYAVVVEVIAENEVVYTETLNVVAVEVAAPSVAIDAVIPTEGAVNRNYTVNATVRNNGNVDFETYSVALVVNGVQQPAFNGENLAAGEEVVVDLTTLVREEATVEVAIAFGAGNYSYTTDAVEVAFVETLDVTFTTDFAQTYEAGELINTEVVLYNNSAIDVENGVLNLRAFDGYETKWIANIFDVNIKAGEEVTIPVKAIEALTEGEWKLFYVLRANGEEFRSEETVVNVVVTPTEVELELNSQVANEVMVGDIVYVEGEIINKGIATDYVLRVYGTELEENVEIAGELELGQTAPFMVPVRIKEGYDRAMITVEVEAGEFVASNMMYVNVIEEQATIEVAIAEPAAEDCVVNKYITVPVTINNATAHDYTNYSAALIIDGVQMPAVYGENLAAGEEVVLNPRFFVREEGTFTVYAVVIADGETFFTEPITVVVEVETGIAALVNDNNVTAIYDLSGRAVNKANLEGGLYIVRYADGSAVRVLVRK